jgi:hypothetical protein
VDRFRAAAALAVGTVGLAALAGCGSSAVGQTVTTADAGPLVSAPTGYRFVGLGHAAIAVPTDWGTNATRCGTPIKNTVIIDVFAVDACAVAPKPAVDSVELRTGAAPSDFRADRTFTIDGVAAEQSRTTCSDSSGPGRTYCSGAVRIPSMQAQFRAASWTDAATVDTILSRIRILPDQVAVPGFRTLAGEDGARSGQVYQDQLRAAGLAAHVRTRHIPALDGGHVLDVSPTPGTFLRPGDVVQTTISAAPRGPADEINVEMNSEDADSHDFHGLTDEQIRRGATITLPVGGRVWAYAFGHRHTTLAAQLQGTSLSPSTWKLDPNKGHSWVATKRGTTRITLTITANGHHIVLGVVHVIVTR